MSKSQAEIKLISYAALAQHGELLPGVDWLVPWGVIYEASRGGLEFYPLDFVMVVAWCRIGGRLALQPIHLSEEMAADMGPDLFPFLAEEAADGFAALAHTA